MALAIAVAVLAALPGGRHVRRASCGPVHATVSRVPAAVTQVIELISDARSSAGHVAYTLRDSRGATMAALDPIADPEGGYLGVYHTQIRAARAGTPAEYAVMLAHSRDLIHWQRLAALVGSGAASPTLRAVPGGPGYLLAYEQRTNTAGYHTIALRYYASRQQLLEGHAAAAVTLPRKFSPFNDGTPAFLSIRWQGALDRSLIMMTFHYEAPVGGEPGADREAVGLLLGFRLWIAARDSAVDRALDRVGLVGGHGEERQFSYRGETWRVYEADPYGADFATWHLVLYRVATGQAYPLAIDTRVGAAGCSFGVPTVSILDPAGGRQRVLTVTMFVFSSGPAASEAGELVFYRPL
jgi:hypothetical protein